MTGQEMTDVRPAHGVREIALLALPAVMASLIEPLAGMVDTAFLGHVSSVMLAALAVTVTILSSFTWVFNFLVNGVTAQVAQALGRGDREELGPQIKLSILVALLAGGGTALLLLSLRGWLFGTLFGVSAELEDLARPYFLLRVLGMPLVLLNLALTGILRGLQQIRLSFFLNLGVTLVNVVLTYLLLFVWDLGLVGAALGTVGSFAFGALAGGGWLLASHREIGLDGRFHVPRQVLRRAFADSGNLIARTAALVGAFAAMTAVVTRLGELALAAHQVALQLWLFSSFLIDGFAITGNMLGARYLGAGRPEWRRELAHRLLLFGAAAGLAFAVAYGIFRRPLQGIFTNDPAVMSLLDGIWWVLALTQPINAMAYVYDGLLFGSRDFAFLRRHMLVGVLGVFVPLLYLGGVHYVSLLGAWLSITGLNLYRCLSCAWCFHREAASGWTRIPPGN